MLSVSCPLNAAGSASKKLDTDEQFERYVSKSVRVWFENQYLATDEGKVYDTFRHHLYRNPNCVSRDDDETIATGRKRAHATSSSTDRSQWRHIDAKQKDTELTRDSLLAKINNNPEYPINPKPADPGLPNSRLRYGKPKQVPKWLEGVLKFANGYVPTWWLARIYTNLDSVKQSGIIRTSRERIRTIDYGDQEAQSRLLENSAYSQFDPAMSLEAEEEKKRQDRIDEFFIFRASHTEMDDCAQALAFFREKNLDPELARDMFRSKAFREIFGNALNKYEEEYQNSKRNAR